MQLKKYFIATLCWLTVGVISAQSAPWTPFPHKQVSFWDQGNGKLDIYYPDSTITNGTSGNIHIFGAKYYGNSIIENCMDTLYRQLASPGSAPFDYKDTLFSDALGRWSFNEGGKSFQLDPFAPIGQSFGFETMLGNGGYDSVSISLVYSLSSDVFGRPDSLKIYELTPYLNGNQVGQPITLKLSKLAGLIEFVPFQAIVRGQTLNLWKIRGFDPVGSGRFGITNHFMDFFGDFYVGDVYKWSSLRSEPTPSGTSQSGIIYTFSRTRDSIMSVSYSPLEDAVTVTVEKVRYGYSLDPQLQSTSFGRVDTITQVYDAITLGYEFQKPNFARIASPRIPSFSSVLRTNLNYPFQHGILSPMIDTLFGDKQKADAINYSSPCVLSSFFPIEYSKTFAWGLGSFSTHYDFMFVQENMRMIGYRKADGRSMGDYSRPYFVGIENSEKSSLRLLNTIANETLWVENKTSQNFSYRLVDIMGSVLQVGTSSDEAFALWVGHLAAGMYFIQLESDGQRTVQKFSVVR